MDLERIKRQANDILLTQSPESTYIEYIASSKQFDKILKILCADYTKSEVFYNSRIVEILNCSEATATNYINRMYNELKVTVMVEGAGKGKYRFIN